MKFQAVSRSLTRVLSVCTLAVGLSLAASSAHANFTSAQLTTVRTALGGENIIVSSESVVEVIPTSTTNAVTTFGLSTAQANAVANQSFFSRLTEKFVFRNVGTRAIGGCAAGAIYGGIASPKEVTVAMKAARVGLSCLAGILAAPAAEFAVASMLAMSAPAWVAVGTGVMVTGIVVGGVNLAFEKLWWEQKAARRQLVVQNGYYVAPQSTDKAYSYEYVSYGDQLNGNRKVRGQTYTQGTTILDDAGTLIGTDTIGGSQGVKNKCTYLGNPGVYTCLP